MDWLDTTLGQVIDIFDHKRAPLSSLQRGKRQGPYPYYGASGVVDHIDDYILQGKYLLVSEDGENLNSRKTPIAFFTRGKFWVNNHAHIIRAKPELADDYFLMSYLANANLSGYITGAAQPKLSQASLKEIKLSLPPLLVQRKIAAILSAYDDLIENNTRRIQILEEMAQTLYREWFVHFRFPGHEQSRMVESEVGPIPKDWIATTVGATASYIGRGISPSYNESADGLVINQKCIREGRLNMAQARSQSKPYSADRRVRFGDVLINSTGIGTLGRVAQVYQDIQNCTVDSHVTIARPNPTVNADYFGFQLLGMQAHFDSLGVGSTGQTELARERVAGTPLLIPPRGLQDDFGKAVNYMRRCVILYGQRNNNLRQTRDLLLPKLISGEVDVADLDITTGEIN